MSLPVYMGAFRGVSFVSNTIRWATRSPYSHIAAIRGDGQSVEAWAEDGVVHRDWFSHGHTDGTVVELYELDMEPLRQLRLWHFMQSQVGRKYDWRSIVSFATRSDKHKSGKWFCSELFAAACVHAGQPLQERVEAYKIPPCWCVRSPRVTYAGTVTCGLPETSARLSEIWRVEPPAAT